MVSRVWLSIIKNCNCICQYKLVRCAEMNQLTQTDSFFVTRADCAILYERLQIARKLTQLWNSLSRFARWNNLQRFWENRFTRWINFVKMIHLAKPDSDFEIVQSCTNVYCWRHWITLYHVESGCGKLPHVLPVARVGQNAPDVW